MSTQVIFHLGYNGGEFSSTRWHDEPIKKLTLNFSTTPRVGDVIEVKGYEWKVFKVKHCVDSNGDADWIDINVERVINDQDDFMNHHLWEWSKK